MSRLPSFTTLRAFEAVVRCRSMTRAANELNVTHSAISKQVQSLEEMLCLTLLRRHARSVEPTSEGEYLGRTLTTAFGLIEAGIGYLRPGPLVVSSSASLTMHWLIPRLAGFRTLHPEAELRTAVDAGPVDLLGQRIDLAIRTDLVTPPGDVVVKHLMREWIGPVCSPEYAAVKNLRTVDDLAHATLLTTSSRPDAWSEWLAERKAPPLEPAGNEPYEHFYLIQHAAACGLGVAIVPRYLLEGDLASGRLIAPFGFSEGKRNVVMWMPPRDRMRQEVDAFAKWLKEEASAAVES